MFFPPTPKKRKSDLLLTVLLYLKHYGDLGISRVQLCESLAAGELICQEFGKGPNVNRTGKNHQNTQEVHTTNQHRQNKSIRKSSSHK